VREITIGTRILKFFNETQNPCTYREPIALEIQDQKVCVSHFEPTCSFASALAKQFIAGNAHIHSKRDFLSAFDINGTGDSILQEVDDG